LDSVADEDELFGDEVKEEDDDDSKEVERLFNDSSSIERVLLYAADLVTSRGSGNLGALGTFTSVST